MWIILLDQSGSMGEPFAGEVQFAGRTRAVDAQRKIDAAKIELKRFTKSFRPEPIAVILFTDTASVAFSGMSSETSRLDAVLDAVKANGRTSVAAAL